MINETWMKTGKKYSSTDMLKLISEFWFWSSLASLRDVTQSTNKIISRSISQRCKSSQLHAQTSKSGGVWFPLRCGGRVQFSGEQQVMLWTGWNSNINCPVKIACHYWKLPEEICTRAEWYRLLAIFHYPIQSKLIGLFTWKYINYFI